MAKGIKKPNEFRRRASSMEVARLAGVSQATVSRIFSKKKNVSEHTKKKVLAAAEKLNYSPSAIARSLIQRTTNIIGIVMHHIIR